MSSTKRTRSAEEQSIRRILADCRDIVKRSGPKAAGYHDGTYAGGEIRIFKAKDGRYYGEYRNTYGLLVRRYWLTKNLSRAPVPVQGP